MKSTKSRKVNLPDIISVLPLRDAVLYPELMIPLVVGRDRSVKLIEDSLKADNIIGLVTQKDPKIEEPKTEDLYAYGTTALITKMIRMPDGTLQPAAGLALSSVKRRLLSVASGDAGGSQALRSASCRL